MLTEVEVSGEVKGSKSAMSKEIHNMMLGLGQGDSL
jgi:hypothetical protein